MKLIFIASAIYLLLTSCSSQLKMVKLYGYKQAVLPGKHSVYETDEMGKQLAQRSRARLNYFIYLSHPDGVDITPMGMWINGIPFGLRAEKVNSPVEMNDDNPFTTVKTLLVPKTTDNVWLLTPIEQIAGKPKLQKQTLAKTNQLVVVYELNGKLHYHTLKEMDPLPTAVMQ